MKPTLAVGTSSRIPSNKPTPARKIGERSIINKGVVIGDGAIVKPGSIVTSDIPANCIAEGCPAKVLST